MSNIIHRGSFHDELDVVSLFPVICTMQATNRITIILYEYDKISDRNHQLRSVLALGQPENPQLFPPVRKTEILRNETVFIHVSHVGKLPTNDHHREKKAIYY